MALDGAMQITEKDEFAYQEMIAHIPLFIHPNPQRVLIIGAGDGGVLREVVKHKCITNITMCEIDEMVIDTCKEFFPNHIQGAYDDKRVELKIDDAGQFIKKRKNYYDVVIIDSSDPEGPANVLFTPEFFEDVRDALTENGVMSNQGECLWLHLQFIKECLMHNKKIFPSVSYAFTMIPTYPSGQIGFMICSKNKDSKQYEYL